MATTKSDFKLIGSSPAESENILVIVGAALDGPSRSPFQLHTTKKAQDVLGNSPLANAYNAAVSSGVSNIILYRLNGQHAEAMVRCITPLESKDVLHLRSVSANEQYNEAQISTYSTHIHFHETKFRPARTYFFDTYATIQQLAYQINQDAYYGILEFEAAVVDPGFDLMEFGAIEGVLTVQLDGGSSEDSFLIDHTVENDNPELQYLLADVKEELNIALFGEDVEDQAAYTPNSMLGMLDFGVIVLADIFYDNDPAFAKMLGEFCLNKQIETGSGCIGIIGTKPLLGTSLEDKKAQLLALSDLEDGEWRNYLQVIVGESLVYESVYSMSNAYSYAGTQARNPYYIMMSNKPLDGIRKLEYQFSKEDVDSLSANGYTCIVPSVRKGYVPYLAVSHSKDTASPMSRPHCVRIANYVSKALTQQLDGYIGGINNTITRVEVTDRVHEILGDIVNSRAIMEYKVNVSFLNRNTSIDLRVEIRPFSEVRSVHSMVTLSVPGGVIR